MPFDIPFIDSDFLTIVHVVQVNISLAAANARLHNAREERDQFEEANKQIVAHLKTKACILFS